MKKITILFIALIFCQFSMAQKNIIKFSPFGLSYGKYNLQYERMLTDYSSASISCSYIHPNIPNLDMLTDYLDDIGIGTSFGGAAVELDYRLYSKNKPGPQGFYIGPYIRYTGIGMSVQIDDLSYPLYDGSVDHLKTGFYGSRTGLGVKLGAQWLLWNCITIDWNFFGLGADYYSLKVYSEGTITESGKTYSNQDVEKTQFFWPGINSDFSISYAF